MGVSLGMVTWEGKPGKTHEWKKERDTMKRFLILALVYAALASADVDNVTIQISEFVTRVRKFRDGPITCYVLFNSHDDAISCIVKPS